MKPMKYMQVVIYVFRGWQEWGMSKVYKYKMGKDWEYSRKRTR